MVINKRDLKFIDFLVIMEWAKIHQKELLKEWNLASESLYLKPAKEKEIYWNKREKRKVG